LKSVGNHAFWRHRSAAFAEAVDPDAPDVPDD
jgi:hypothetical protein